MSRHRFPATPPPAAPSRFSLALAEGQAFRCSQTPRGCADAPPPSAGLRGVNGLASTGASQQLNVVLSASHATCLVVEVIEAQGLPAPHRRCWGSVNISKGLFTSGLVHWGL